MQNNDKGGADELKQVVSLRVTVALTSVVPLKIVLIVSGKALFVL